MTAQMTSTAMPTAEQHGFRPHSDGAFVPVQTRSERFRSVDVGDFEPVTGREHEWKLSPVAAFADLTGGPLDGSRVEIETADVAGVDVTWIARDDARVGRTGIPEERASANAWSSFGEALLITVAGEDEKVAAVTRQGLGDQPRGAHTVIEAAPNSRGLVVLRGTGAARLSENVEIVVGEGASLTVVSLQEWDDDAVHLASHFARLGRDSFLKHIVVSLGGKVVRVNPSTHLAEQGSDVEALGLYFADAGQHLEQQVFVHHDAPHTRSRVTYKGALQGAGARTVWVGDVLIRKVAEGIETYESNRNLVLTDGCQADSVPNLEIETGEITGAGHASATGRFDDQQLFYLQSRGIHEDEARRLVVHGFFNDLIRRIDVPALEEQLAATVEAELSKNVLKDD